MFEKRKPHQYLGITLDLTYLSTKTKIDAEEIFKICMDKYYAINTQKKKKIISYIII